MRAFFILLPGILFCWCAIDTLAQNFSIPDRSTPVIKVEVIDDNGSILVKVNGIAKMFCDKDMENCISLKKSSSINSGTIIGPNSWGTVLTPGYGIPFTGKDNSMTLEAR